MGPRASVDDLVKIKSPEKLCLKLIILSITRRFLKENTFLSFVVFDGSIKITAQNKICIPLCMKIKIYETFLENFKAY